MLVALRPVWVLPPGVGSVFLSPGGPIIRRLDVTLEKALAAGWRTRFGGSFFQGDRERSLREAAESLLSALETIQRVSKRLAEADEGALHQRAETLLSGGNRLQEDVARALGDEVRERIVGELSNPKAKKPKLSVA